MYEDPYYEAGGPCRPLTEGGYLANEEVIRVESRRLLTHIVARSGRMLDIGSAGGVFGDEARRAGFDVTCIELNTKMAHHASTQFGLHVINASALEVAIAPETFDVVVAHRVLEHVPPIDVLLRRIARWLKPGGVLLVSGPFEGMARKAAWYNLKSLLGRPQPVVREPPYHVHGFTRRSWNAILLGAGLRPLRLDVSPAQWPLRVRSLSDAVAFPMEAICWVIDVATGGGDFMVAVASKPSQ